MAAGSRRRATSSGMAFVRRQRLEHSNINPCDSIGAAGRCYCADGRAPGRGKLQASINLGSRIPNCDRDGTLAAYSVSRGRD
jgi:hypothetical protein